MFNFVLDCSDEALETYLSITEEAFVKVFTKGDLNWCLQTFLILEKRAKLPVKCSNHLQENCINIIHSDQLLKLKGNIDQFIVCVRADYPRRPWAHYHLVQNQNQLGSDTSYIPHWVQPGLVRRNPMREGVSSVAYSGAPIKGNFAGSLESWKRLFDPHGIDFEILSSGIWHNLSEVDVLVGIRSFTKQTFNTKPPTKLFNAWHANIPFVGGNDSAFRQVGVPGEDYLLASTAEEVVAAVLQLRQEPDLYAKLVENGQQKAKRYNQQTIADVWEEVLSGPVARRYEQWAHRPSYEYIRFNFMQDIGLLENSSKQLVKRILKVV